MRVYHGSSKDFDKPLLSKAKDYRDFGNGFYVTENYFDALGILKAKEGFIYEYKLSLDTLRIKRLEGKEESFDFIYKNRTEKIKENTYDVIIGKTASGKCWKVFKEIRNKGLKVDKLTLREDMMDDYFGEQICIKTEKGMECLELIGREEYNKEDFN